MKTSEAVILTFDHKGSDVHDQNRPLTVRRPCSCGCDQRRAPEMIGYLNAIKDGVGFTVEITDEETYRVFEAVLG